MVKNILWILPFLSFLGGYQLLRTFSHVVEVEVPSVVGLHMHDAIKNLSFHRLNVRILAEKEEQDLPEGLILSQTPLPGKKVKPQQSIFLVTTRQPLKPQAPALFGLTKNEAQALAQQRGITLKADDVESMLPQGTCIAQSVEPGISLPEKTITALFSAGSPSIYLFPDVKGKALEEVIPFFQSSGIQVIAPASCGIITDQRPLPGTIIDLKKPPVIYLSLNS